MAKCTILIGLPGSGKTTYAKQYLINNNVIYLSSDDMRVELFGYENQTDNTKVFDEMNNRTRKALQSDMDVIYDATNLSRKRRKHFIQTVCRGFEVDAMLFCCPIDIIRVRNITRSERHLPDDKLENMITNIDIPLYYEGFNDIFLVNTYGDMTKIIKSDIEYAHTFNQRNPHHNKTLGGHIDDIINYVNKYYSVLEINILKNVAMFHDLGKLYTQIFDENNVAHYYRHEKVSAYLYLCSIIPQQNGVKQFICGGTDYYIALIIAHHMDLYNPNTVKLEAVLGSFLYDLLTKFHKADMYREEL